MCGIAGALSLNGSPVDPQDVRAMCSAMIHRGPDDEGIFAAPQVALGMRRLSIIDLSSGHQPIANEDDTVQAVLNGEIYNYRELRRSLEARGHVFKTSSDTETIVHLYEERGDACVDELRGMFCFAIWDSRRQHLLVARDRLGIKPLYYTRAGGKLLFASELKCLLALPEVERKVSLGALDHLLTTLTTPAAESILEGVHKLEPGCLITHDAGQTVPRISRYWRPRFEPRAGRSSAEWEEQLRAALDESVGMHMVADVPLGAFLSGGVDSSSVVASMVRQSALPVKTFSIGFQEEEFNELKYARAVATSLGTEHRELVVEPASLSMLESIAWHLDEPFGDSSAIPTYLVSQLAAREVKVVLSGDGGDELFGGYERYLVEGRERARAFPIWMRRFCGWLSARLPRGARGKRWLRHQSLPDAERYLDACGLFAHDEKARLLARRTLSLDGHRALSADARAELSSQGSSGPSRELHWLSQLQLQDLDGYLPLDILTKVDRMSMAHSIEARVPLLDHKFVELALTVPPEFLIKNGSGKHVFKEAMRPRLPSVVLDRPKRGFAIPLGKWFRGHLSDYARDLLLSERARQRGFFDMREVQRMLDQPARDELGLQVWTLLSVELWCRAFLDAGPRAPRAERSQARRQSEPGKEQGMEAGKGQAWAAV